MSPPSRDRAPRVYSSEQGRLCPSCGQPITDCCCRRQAPPVKPSGGVRVGRETKGRKGKGVTVISGLPLATDALQQLASDLKKRCGCGGTVKDGVIEIQGDHRDLLLAELQRRGFAAKKSGG
jgi:translation initiation factor 1